MLRFILVTKKKQMWFSTLKFIFITFNFYSNKFYWICGELQSNSTGKGDFTVYIQQINTS